MANHLHEPEKLLGKVVIESGHMIDTPGRAQSRFPNEKAEAVRVEIARQLRQWDIGPSDRAICGGACGADILFAEECVRRGASLRLYLAQGAEAFVRDSVQHGGRDWVRRFRALAVKAQVEILPPSVGHDSADLSIYARTNLWIIETARAEVSDASKLCALLVWDENRTGDGPGGTSDFEARVRDLGGNIAIIDPTKLSP